ncbi:MAG: MFS transporter [Victivallaceae bacterium]|nr:MFS transporter [Victivallaceae bacterium]
MIGHLCDRILPRKLLLPVLIVSGAATLVQALSGDIQTLMISRFLTYLAAGGLQPILQVMLAKVTSSELRGTYLGWSASVNTAGGIVSSLLSGGIAYYVGVRGIFISAAMIFLFMIPLIYPTIKASKQEYVCDPNATRKTLKSI